MSYIINTNNDLELSFAVEGTNYSQLLSSFNLHCSAPPTESMATENFNAIAIIGGWPAQLALAQNTYSDQEGVLGAMILFAEARRLQAAAYSIFWHEKHVLCAAKYNLFTFHCNNQSSTCEMSFSDLEAAAVKASSIQYSWSVLKNSLLTQLDIVANNELVYSTNQTLQAQLTSLLAQVNIDIAESNLQVQAVENQLLDLKQKELKSKAMFIIAPLLLLLGIALIYND